MTVVKPFTDEEIDRRRRWAECSGVRGQKWSSRWIATLDAERAMRATLLDVLAEEIVMLRNEARERAGKKEGSR